MPLNKSVESDINNVSTLLVTPPLSGIEMFRKIMDEATAGDNIGIMARGLKKDEVERGMIMCKPGSIKQHQKFQAQVRKQPLFFSISFPPCFLGKGAGACPSLLWVKGQVHPWMSLFEHLGVPYLVSSAMKVYSHLPCHLQPPAPLKVVIQKWTNSDLSWTVVGMSNDQF